MEHVVTWGLKHRNLDQIDAIGGNEIQYAKGHKKSHAGLQGFFAAIGHDGTSKIAFVCSDMWEPYLRVIREKCSQDLIFWIAFTSSPK